MASETLLHLVFYIVFAVLVSTFAGVVFFIRTAPTPFDPYSPDSVLEVDETEKTSGKSIGQDAGYAHFSKGRDTVKTLKNDVSVQVVVLGDVGRSPRMQYHAMSLAKLGAQIDLIGFHESDLYEDLQDNRNVKLIPLIAAPGLVQNTSSLPFIITGPFKAMWQAFDLYHALGYRSRASRWMLVQNPPSIPVLAIAQLICFLRSTKLVIDWHNFGWSVLSTRLGLSHPLVRIARWYESVFSASADAHFCVTDAMARTIAPSLSTAPLVLHDRPAHCFQPLKEPERWRVLSKLEQTAPHLSELKAGKWRLIVSSTSWTADEDFSVFLDALVQYSAKAEVVEDLPSLLVVITGKGPQKEHYLTEISRLNQGTCLSNVIISTAWLSFPDYAALLASADLGVCLHQSTSGLDLPMKVLDMFGAGLPVAGWNAYETWEELVHEDVNGKGFSSADGLAHILEELLGGDGTRLQELRAGAIREGQRRWDDEWETVASKLFVPNKRRPVK